MPHSSCQAPLDWRRLSSPCSVPAHAALERAIPATLVDVLPLDVVMALQIGDRRPSGALCREHTASAPGPPSRPSSARWLRASKGETSVSRGAAPSRIVRGGLWSVLPRRFLRHWEQSDGCTNAGKDTPQTLDFVPKCGERRGLATVWLECNPALSEELEVVSRPRPRATASRSSVCWFPGSGPGSPQGLLSCSPTIPDLRGPWVAERPLYLARNLEPVFPCSGRVYRPRTGDGVRRHPDCLNLD